MNEATAGRDPEAGFGTPDVHDGDLHDDWDGPAPGPPDPTAVESVVNALLEAGPDVAEHVVRAAQELLLAAQAVVDAAQHAVEEQQALRRPADARTDGADDRESGAPVDATAADDPSSPSATVHHLDVGE